MNKFKRNLSYVMILGGGILALYEQSKNEANQYVIILGLVMLMVGVYLTSKRIPKNNDASDDHEQGRDNI
jgi:disulfide bond formation protein DsbB